MAIVPRHGCVMLLGRNCKLEELVVLALARIGAATAAEIQTRLGQANGRYSIQGIYQELRKLRRDGVVVKSKQRYALKLAWILDLSTLSSRMYQTYTSGSILEDLLDDRPSGTTWRFSDIHQLDNFWTNLILALCRHAPKSACYMWAPHAWWHLAHDADERQFLRAMGREGNPYFIIIGSSTYLDAEYVKFMDPAFCRYSFAESPFHLEQHVYYASIGDYFITVRLDEATRERIDELFHSVKSSRVPLGRIVAAFNKPIRGSVQLRHQPKKARAFQAKFRRFFGVAD